MTPQKTNKLFVVIAALSVEEVKDFVVFVNSPFFNSNKNVCKTVEYLKKINQLQSFLWKPQQIMRLKKTLTLPTEMLMKVHIQSILFPDT